MRRSLWWVLLAAVLLFVPGILLAQTQQPSPAPAISEIVAEDVFVRGGPGRSYVPVGSLEAGDQVYPVSRNSDADWVMIRYYSGFGWVRRDLAFWIEDIDSLPVMLPSRLTPSAVPGQESATPFVPTETPEGNWVTVADMGAFVRAGPGRGYLRLDTLFSGDVIEEPLGRNEDSTWVMFRYGEGFAWIAENLVQWVEDIEALPILSEDALTPSATFTASATPTATHTLTSTSTPTDTPTATLTHTPTATVTASATTTATPSHTATLTTTATASATDTTVPTATATTTETDTPSPAPSDTATPTIEIAEATPTHTPTATASDTATETATIAPTETFTATSSATSTATETDVPTAIALAQASNTPRPSRTPLPSPTPSDTATATLQPSETATATATATDLPTTTPSATQTATDEPTATSSATQTATDLPSATPSQTQTATDEPTATLTLMTTHDETARPTETAESGAVIVSTATVEMTPTLVPQTTDGDGSATAISPEALVAGLIVLVVIGYVALYMRGAAAVDRYALGFVIDECPVCATGRLRVDTRQERTFGIPTARRTVNCDNCRSVLRETGYRRWRYAVDPVVNPTLHARMNERELTEDELVALWQEPASGMAPAAPRQPFESPTFTDDDEA